MLLRSLVLLLALAAPATPLRADVLTPSSADAAIELKDVVANGGAVSGAIENHGPRPVKDIQLLIQHRYVWPNEYKPGAANPGRAEKITMGDEIPPGGRATFSHDSGPLESPDPKGRFETSVTVLSFVEVLPPQPLP